MGGVCRANNHWIFFFSYLNTYAGMRANQEMVPKIANNAQSNCNRSTVAIFMTLNRNRFHLVGDGRGVFEKAIAGELPLAG